VQLHVDDAHYGHSTFRPWRIVAALLKALRPQLQGASPWRDFPYEYEHSRLAFDLINGGPRLREWIDDDRATPADLDALAGPEERAWDEQRREVLLYPAA